MADPKKISQFDVAQTFSEGDFLSGIQQVAPSEYKNVKIPHSAMLGISSEMFELVDNDGNPYIKAKLDLLGEKAITAYATGTLGNDVWKDMPIATTDSLGGIMVGDHLTITPEGKLSVVAENLGLNESAIINLVNSSTAINVYDSKRLGGKLPTDYSLATHTHFNHTAGAGLTGNAYNGGAAVEWGVSPTIITQLNQLSTMFELVPNSGNPYIKAKLDLLGQKGITAYATGTLGNDIWADLPVATDVTLGGVKVSPGSGLVMNGEQLEIDGDSFNLNNYYTKTNIDAFFAGTTAKTGYNKSNWDSAYADRLKWNGGSTGLDAATGRTSLGLTGTVTTHTHTDVPNLTYYSGYDANKLITGRLSNYGSARYWENAPSNMLYGGIIAFGGESAPASKSLGLQIAYDINHNTTGLTKDIWFRSGGDTPNGVEWGTDWFKLYHTGNLVNPVTGTGSAGRVAFWNSTTGLTSNADFLFNNGILSFVNGTGGTGVYITNTGIRFKSSGTGGWPMAITAVDQSNTLIGNIVGGWGGANSILYAYLGGTAYNNAALYAHPNNSVSINKTTVTTGYILDINGNTRVDGNILATGEVTAYTASDARLKTNITSLASINALDIINQLNPVTYTWNDRAVQLNGNKNTSTINYGLIAQELEQIVPDLIRPIYGDYKTYDDRGLMTIMLQAIKELKAEVDLLKNKN